MAHYVYYQPPIQVGGEKFVYRGRCVGDSKEVIIKILRPPITPQSRQHFADEIKRLSIAKRSAGAGIATLIDHNVNHNPPFLVEEYFQEGSLATKMARLTQQRLVVSVPYALKYVRQLLLHLHGIHMGGQIHRDIKPANILVRNEHNLVITDMGLGRTLTRPSFLQTMAFQGTPAYAAPEQGNGSPVDARADLYAVGVILHELLTGDRGAYNHITFSNDVEVRRLLDGLLAFWPVQRYPSALAALQYVNSLKRAA